MGKRGRIRVDKDASDREEEENQEDTEVSDACEACGRSGNYRKSPLRGRRVDTASVCRVAVHI